jgi:hypothetical protein
MRRQQKFLPIALLALALQMLAPVVACWAAGIATSDPLQATAAICHDGAGQEQGDQGSGDRAHNGACSICCAARTSASFDTPKSTVAVAIPYRQSQDVVWHNVATDLSPSRSGSNKQARAPPRLK